jgi:hypothetical protein
MNTLAINLVLSTLVFWAAARVLLLPRLDRLSPQAVLLPILVLHSLRHLGLMFLSPGATYQGMPPQFAYPAAFGDLLTAILAFAGLFAVARDFRTSRPLLWVFSVVGSVDLAIAIVLATVYDAEHFMGAAYWIPAFWVPALLVTHYLTFVVLLRHVDRRRQPARAEPV